MEEGRCSAENHVVSSAGDYLARLDLSFRDTVTPSKLYSTLQSPLSSPSRGSQQLGEDQLLSFLLFICFTPCVFLPDCPETEKWACSRK